MKWKIKARILNLISALPSSIGYRTLYWIQRHFGDLKNIDLEFELSKSIHLTEILRKQNISLKDKVLMEIGTGRTVNTEIGMWLSGTRQIIAVDLNPYLVPELVEESVDWLKKNADKIRNSFLPVVEDKELFESRLYELSNMPVDYDLVLKLINLKYMAPCNAAEMQMGDSSIDVHFSTNVLEHIPPQEITKIFSEAKRLLKPEGITIHRVDPSDHFISADKSITAINFLQFSKEEWERIANNKFSYHNRLRAVEFYQLFNHIGLDLISKEEVLDTASMYALEHGFRVHPNFSHFSNEELATTFFTFIGKFN